MASLFLRPRMYLNTQEGDYCKDIVKGIIAVDEMEVLKYTIY